MENIVTRPRPVSRGKILSWEEDGEEDSEPEEASGSSSSPPQLNFPSRGSDSRRYFRQLSISTNTKDFDRRRYLKQLSTNTKDLDSIEPR